MPEGFVYDDGGRAAAGFRGDTGDCVTRAVAIATGRPYAQVYREVHDALREFAERSRSRQASAMRKRGISPRHGVPRDVFDPYLASLGWRWTPTMAIGTGTQTHLRAAELPPGRLIVRVSRHMCAVVDGVVRDTFDPRRDGTRAVYGYWQAPASE